MATKESDARYRLAAILAADAAVIRFSWLPMSAPLSVPEAGTSAYEATNHGAVALFVDQAHAADQYFKLTDDNVAPVIHLCRHLSCYFPGCAPTPAGHDSAPQINSQPRSAGESS